MARFSKNKMVLSRVQKLKKRIKINTQRMRGDALRALEELFEMAKDLAKSEGLDLNARRKWLQVAAYICQVINSICKGFDERQIDKDLDELERLINEAKTKAKSKKTKRKTKRTRRT